MRVYLVVLFALAIGMSACRNPNFRKDQSSTEKQRLANEIRGKVASKLKQEIDLRPIGTMGQMLRDIQKLGLSFNYYQPIDIAEGRQLLMRAVTAMVNEVNQEKRIHPYLCRYPFLPRNVEIAIFLRRPDGRDSPPESLAVIDAQDGFLRYQIDHPKRVGFLTIYKETYQEALERIADPSLPLVPFQPDPEISQEEWEKIRKGICLVADDGAIWHMGENGSWVKP